MQERKKLHTGLREQKENGKERRKQLPSAKIGRAANREKEFDGVPF